MKKRIALAAVAALAGGLIVAAPASAAAAYATADYPFVVTVADTGITGAVVNETATATMSATQVAGPSNYIAIKALQEVSSGNAVLTVTGGTVISAAKADATETPTVNATATQVTFLANGLVDQVVKIATPTAGTITAVVSKVVEATAGQFTTTTLQTFTFTVTAASVSGVASAATSSAYIVSTATAFTVVPDSADSATVTAIKTAAGVAANIEVQLRDGNGARVAATAISPLTATIAGPGYLKVETGTAGAVGAHVTGLGAASEFTRGAVVTNGSGAVFAVYGDGTAGVSTITITHGALSWTKTVTFYGAAASISATVVKANISNAAATTGAIDVQVKDANGVLVPSQNLTITSSDITKLSNFSEVSASATDVALGTEEVDVPAGIATKTGEITLTIALTADATIKTTAKVVLSNAVAAAAVLAFDKAEYAPGEKATVTVTLKDAAGNVVADGSYIALTSTGLTYSANVGAASSNETVTTTAGVAKYTVFMPLAAGPVSVAATTSTNAAIALALQDTEISASTKVVAPVDATAAAINAKVQSTEATVAALQVTVASIIKSLKVQWWLLKKIAVKVGIKLG